jgi:plasmid stabilization system protein ParE
MRVRWSRRSREHLVDIREYIRQQNGDAAERVRLRIIETVGLLSALPRLGHAGNPGHERRWENP